MRPIELLNKKCGIIGAGGIGLNLAEKIKKFRCENKNF